MLRPVLDARPRTVVSKGNKQQLDADDLFALPEDQKSASAWRLFEPAWQDAVERARAVNRPVTVWTLLGCVWHCCWRRWLWSYVCAVIGEVTRLFVPYILTDIVDYLADPNASVGTGLLYVAAIVLVTMFTSIMTYYSVYLTQALSIGVCPHQSNCKTPRQTRKKSA